MKMKNQLELVTQPGETGLSQFQQPGRTIFGLVTASFNNQ